MSLSWSSTVSSLLSTVDFPSESHAILATASTTMTLSTPSLWRNTVSSSSLTTRKLVNQMGIPNLYNVYDYRVTTATLDSAGQALRITCEGKYESSLSQFIASEMSIGAITTGGSKIFCDSLGPTTTRCYTLVTTYGTLPDVFPFQPSSPCCNRCSITAGDIQVYRWPLSTSEPSFSTLVNSNGFTFTYPSVYVAIQTLEGNDLCGPVGPKITSIPTIGFDATDLSTAVSYWFPSDWEFLGDGELYETWARYSGLNVQTSVECTNITTTVYWLGYVASAFQNPSTYVDTMYNSTYTCTAVAATYNSCTPYLSIPTPLLTHDPRWSTCIRFIAGLRDPPINLEPENGFYPVTTTSVPPAAIPTNTKGPVAPQAFQQFSASKTQPPWTQSTSVSNNDPSQPNIFISKLPAVMTFKGSYITADSVSGFVIGSYTLTPGGGITVLETLLSMASDGLNVVIDKTSTQLLEPKYVAGTQTVSAGGPGVTLSGTLFSVQPGGRSVVIGGSTTEDIDGLLRGTTASVGGSWASQSVSPSSSHGAVSASTSRKTECRIQFRWQLILFMIVVYSTFK